MSSDAEKESQILKNLFETIESYISSDKKGEFTKSLDPRELLQVLDLDLEGVMEDPETLRYWVDAYFKYAVKTHHYGFSNRMWAGANIASIVGEIVTAVSQTSAGSYEAAPVSVLMEKYMIGRMLDLVGFTKGEGQMTTGSSNANMIAMMSARNLVSKDMKTSGLFGQHELFAFVNQYAHYSLDNAANILGIGLDHLIKIPVDHHGRMNLDVLKEKMEEVISSGGKPFFVTATMGTTVRGSYDPLPELLKMREKYHFWLHADGAWGGAAIMSDALRGKYLQGIESADSFTLDFHKMPGSSLMCNVLLFNNRPGVMNAVCNAGDRTYLHHGKESGGIEYDLGASSLQCGRRVDSLKWFLDWKFYQKEGFARRFEKYHSLAEAGEKIIEESDELEMVVPRESFNLCFRYKCDGDKNGFNKELRSELLRRGKALVSYAFIEGELCLRLLITHKDMDESNLRDLLQTIAVLGRELESGSI